MVCQACAPFLGSRVVCYVSVRYARARARVCVCVCVCVCVRACVRACVLACETPIEVLTQAMLLHAKVPGLFEELRRNLTNPANAATGGVNVVGPAIPELNDITIGGGQFIVSPSDLESFDRIVKVTGSVNINTKAQYFIEYGGNHWQQSQYYTWHQIIGRKFSMASLQEVGGALVLQLAYNQNVRSVAFDSLLRVGGHLSIAGDSIETVSFKSLVDVKGAFIFGYNAANTKLTTLVMPKIATIGSYLSFGLYTGTGPAFSSPACAKLKAACAAVDACAAYSGNSQSGYGPNLNTCN